MRGYQYIIWVYDERTYSYEALLCERSMTDSSLFYKKRRKCNWLIDWFSRILFWRGFFLACEDFGESFDEPVPSCQFCKPRSTLAHQFHSLGREPIYSGCGMIVDEWGGCSSLVEHLTVKPLTQVRFPGATRVFSPRVNFHCRYCYACPYTPCAIACINICAHVKDPVVHVRIRWIMDTETPSMHAP